LGLLIMTVMILGVQPPLLPQPSNEGAYAAERDKRAPFESRIAQRGGAFVAERQFSARWSEERRSLRG
jgi:hypothetical protein